MERSPRGNRDVECDNLIGDRDGEPFAGAAEVGGDAPRRGGLVVTRRVRHSRTQRSEPASAAPSRPLVRARNARTTSRGRVVKLIRRRVIVCQEWTELITDYLEGALPRSLVRAIDRHLAGCPHCTEYLAQMRRTIEITGHIDGRIKGEETPTVPDDLLDLLQRAFDD